MMPNGNNNNKKKKKAEITCIKPPIEIVKRIRCVVFFSELNIDITHLLKS